MTLPDPAALPLSPTAQSMLALRDVVFRVWEQRVRERIPPARALQHPILVDTLPAFYQNIVDSVDPSQSRRLAVDGTTMAAGHGGERARITAYSHDAINGSIDAGIQEAVEGFALVHSGFRERFAAALKRALENLVVNAVKYGTPGTPITIDSQEIHGRLVFAVHNEGPPIPPEKQECIFQMYRRAEAARRNAQPGWGIGLPYVRAVAESHGGSIGLDTSAERGTTFLIDMPLKGLLDAPTLEPG